jgi:S-adenosyl-L-methionine hydrolase (adenosine-forming)
MTPPIIAILTDFGEKDFFVPSMKGVIKGINPDVHIVDISHQVPSYDIQAGAFVLNAVFPYFPAGTVFLSVVDPGVGTPRRILLAQFEGYSFVAPDNGILSYVLAESDYPEVRHVTARHYFLPQTGQTFEGRDIMAPVAAWVSKNMDGNKFGELIDDFTRFPYEQARISEESLAGRIVYQDKFGNLISNISAEALHALAPNHENLIIRSSNHEIPLVESYRSVEKGRLLALTGSLGSIEIAVREGSAAEETGLKPGDSVVIRKKFA